MFQFAMILPLLLAAVPGGAATPPAVDKDRLHGEVARLLDQLDSDRFEVRQAAAERIEQLVAQPELGPLLAAEFQRALVRPDVSFEVRWHLNRWRQQLPPPVPEPVANISMKELDELVRRLDDDSYARRVGAAERLDWLLGNPKLVCPVMLRLKRRLADGVAGIEERRQLEATWQHARGAWLLSDPAGWNLPAVSDEQIAAWLDDLAGATAAGSAAAARRSDAAERELTDLLARDEYVARVTNAIRARMTRERGADATARLTSLLEWTKPAIVAEIWQMPRAAIRPDRRCGLRQTFVVGVSTQWPGAEHPVLFDRVDEHMAHSVSGNALSPGNYPVGEAFPHPRLNESSNFFYLVNLPTPRRRMAYLYYAETDEAKQLAAISRRTLDSVLADRRPLTEPELLMLEGLDPAEVSRFAGKYFLLVNDSSMIVSGTPRLGGRPSRFGMICVRLALDGMKGAVPGLTSAIAQDRFLPATSNAPYRLHWLAALSIAGRDPWPEVEAWLADRIGQSVPLVAGRASAPELGATAAALLLRRHGQTPETFGLRPAADPVMDQLHVDGYRFDGPDARKKVEQWWTQEKGKKRAATNSSDGSSAGGRSSPRRPPAAAIPER